MLRLSEKTRLSYPHLSKIENDSVVPTPQTVVTLVETLGGDLNLMLELADCLPKQILDRLTSRPETPSLKRAAGGGGKPSTPDERVAAIARALGVPESEVGDTAEAVVTLLRLDSRRRRAVVQLMRTFDGGGGGQR